MFVRQPNEILLTIADYISNSGENPQALKAVAQTNKFFNQLVHNQWKKDPNYANKFAFAKKNSESNIAFVKSVTKELNDYLAGWKKSMHRSQMFYSDKTRGKHIEDLIKEIETKPFSVLNSKNQLSKSMHWLVLKIAEEMQYAEDKNAKIYMQTLDRMLKIIIDFCPNKMDELIRYLELKSYKRFKNHENLPDERYWQTTRYFPDDNVRTKHPRRSLHMFLSEKNKYRFTHSSCRLREVNYYGTRVVHSNNQPIIEITTMNMTLQNLIKKLNTFVSQRRNANRRSR